MSGSSKGDQHSVRGGTHTGERKRKKQPSEDGTPHKRHKSSDTPPTTHTPEPEEEPEPEDVEEHEEHEEDEEEEYIDGEDFDDPMSGGNSMQQAQMLMKHVSELGMLLPFQGGKIVHIAQKLDKPDEGEQFQALTELCELLSMSSEEALMGFRVSTLLPGLVRCMQNEANQEVMLLSCQALSHLMDALPDSISAIVSANVVPVLIEKLLNLQVIDMAEQSLLCLEKICQEHAIRVLSEGGMGAMLTFVDFFSLHLQRKIVGSICNMVRRVPASLFQFVEDCLPQLSMLLTYEDSRLVEATCLSLHRLVSNFQDDEAKLALIGSEGMLGNLMMVLQKGVDLTSPNIWSIILKTLTVLAKHSVTRTQTILNLDAHRTLLNVLKGHTETNLNTEGMAASALQGGTPSQVSKGISHGTVSQVVELLRVMLPVVDEGLLSTATCSLNYYLSDTAEDSAPLAREATGTSQPESDTMAKAYSWQYGDRPEDHDEDDEEEDEEEEEEEASADRMKVQRSEGSSGGSPVAPRTKRKSSAAPAFNAEAHEARKAMYISNPNLLAQFADGIPSLIAVYEGSVHSYSKLKSLAAVASIIHHSPPDLIKSSLRDVPVSAFVASLLRQSGNASVLAGLHLAHQLLQKQPELFAAHFVREGATAEVQALLDSISKKLADAAAPPSLMSDDTTESPERRNLHLIQETCRAYLTRCESLVDKNCLEKGAKLLAAVSALNEWCDGSSEEEKGAAHLERLCHLLSAEDGVSTFEFATSRVVPVLLKYLCAETARTSQADRTLQLQRAKRFLQAFLVQIPPGAAYSLPLEAGNARSNPSTHLAMFVHRLVLALQHYERLPVYSTESTEGGGWSAALKALTQPFRLSLTRTKEEREKEKAAPGTPAGATPQSSVTVMIEPLATIAAVEEFVSSKLARGGPSCTAEEGEQRLFMVHPHKLTKSSQKARGWTCDRCSTSFSGPGQTRWRCEPCDFDVCGVCAPHYQAAPGAKEGSTSTPKERKGSAEASPAKEKKRSGLFNFPRRRSKEADTKVVPPQTPERDAATSSSSSQSSQQPATPTQPPAPPAVSVAIYLDGALVPSDQTIFSAIFAHRASQLEQKKGDDTPHSPNLLKQQSFGAQQDIVINTKSIWGKAYKLTYKIEDKDEDKKEPNSPVTPTPGLPKAPATPTTALPMATQGSFNLAGVANTQQRVYSSYGKDFLGAAEYLDTCSSSFPEVKQQDTETPDAASVLRLLKVMHSLCQSSLAILETEGGEVADARTLVSGIPNEGDFRARSISNKLLKQMLDGLLLCTGQLSQIWCAELVYHCPFLFSFSTRLAFFELTSFGPTRSVIRLQEILQEEGEECKVKVGRVHKQKIQLERESAFESAKRVMSLYGSQRSYLEFEFFDEVGTGLGPTLEFYTVVSKGIREDAAGAFLSADGANYGLFPKPVDFAQPAMREGRAAVLAYFKFVGAFVSRAIYDKRLVDVPLCPALLTVLSGGMLHPSDLRFVVPDVWKTVLELRALASQRDAIVAKYPEGAASAECRSAVEGKVLFKGATFADLSLDFTLPGHPDIALKENGEDTTVTVWNMEEYAQLVCEWFLDKGISQQVCEQCVWCKKSKKKKFAGMRDD